MATYTVRHLSDHKEYTRPSILLNLTALPLPPSSPSTIDPAIEAFHKQLPDYSPTPLHNLPSIAADLGISSLFLKDESTRFSLPAFKILGASWAIFRYLCERYGFALDSSFEEVRRVTSGRRDFRLVTCSEGNWGRAVARMGRILGLDVRVYVPGFMTEFTRELLKSEGAEAVVLEGGSYDDAIAATREEAEREPGKVVMVMDTSWEGYEVFPKVSSLL